MVDAGYGADDPALRLNHWKYFLRAVTNTLMDIRIHTGTMTEDEAMTMMVDGGFQERSEATEKWSRARLSSTQLCSYYLGSVEMTELEREAAAAPTPTVAPSHGGRSSSRSISHGTPPMPVIRDILFGGGPEISAQIDGSRRRVGRESATSASRLGARRPPRSAPRDGCATDISRKPRAERPSCQIVRNIRCRHRKAAARRRWRRRLRLRQLHAGQLEQRRPVTGLGGEHAGQVDVGAVDEERERHVLLRQVEQQRGVRLQHARCARSPTAPGTSMRWTPSP